MLFKKNPEKAKLRSDIRAKQLEIRELKKLHGKWIKSFMKESDPIMAGFQIAVIRVQATRISNEEELLTLMQKHYKLL